MQTRVYRGTWPDQVQVLWRDLTWGEFQQVRNHPGPPRLRHLDVFEKCYFGGFPKDRVPAGVVHFIGEHQLAHNPFNGIYPLLARELAEKRNRVRSSYLDTASAVISSVFQIPFSEIRQWPPDLFFTRLAQAELVMGRLIEPTDPNAPAQASGAPAGRHKRRPEPGNYNK